MKDGKAIILGLVVFLFASYVFWLGSVLPPQKFKTILKDLPTLTDIYILSAYPDNLIVTAKNGQVDINQPSPYCLEVDKSGQFNILYDALAVPNPSAFSATSQYKDFCPPTILVGKDFVMYPDGSKQNQYKINTFPANLNYTVNKQVIVSFVDTILPKIIDFGQTFYYFIPIFIFIIAYPFILLTNFWYTLISKLVLKLFKVDKSLFQGKVYGTNLVIFSSILLFNLLVPEYPISFPFANTLATSLGCLAYFRYLSQSQQGNDQTPVAPVK